MDDSQDKPRPPAADYSRRFLFEDGDIRGETVHLAASYREVVDIHQYAPGVSRLLGEFLAAAVLLKSTLKFDGKLILQARSGGQIPLLMAECNSAGEVRGIARGVGAVTSVQFDQLLGNGQLAITVDPSSGKRYQGIVPLAGDSLAASLDAYFEQSEQLKTRFWLASSGERAGGMLLQQLPAQLVPEPLERERQWEHACTLAATLRDEELLDLPTDRLLHRLYHQNSLRLFTPLPVSFRCSCSRERTLAALSALDRGEVEDLLRERGCITMDCEFCNQQYRYQRDDLEPLLGDNFPPTLH